MKPFIALCLLMIAAFGARAQTQKTDSLYIVTFTTGSSWDAAKSPNEQSYFKEHSMRLSELRKAGVIKFGARYAEKGIIVISSPTLQAAKALISEDPAVNNKLFNADVQKL